MPALPLDEAGKYVAGAYVVFVGLLLVYVAIMAVRLERMRNELSELADLAERRAERRTKDEGRTPTPEQREPAGVPRG
jgi:hypothetical protein